MNIEHIVTILPSFLYFLALILSVNVLSLIEKSYRHSAPTKSYKSFERNSLYLFKRARFLLTIIASVEFYRNGNILFTQLAIGLMLIVLGLLLRIFAIRALGPYWSYDIRIYRKAKIVRNGIYRYLRHPAYLGNIYIPGLFLIGNCYVSTAISITMITWFYFYRASIENRIVYSRSIQNA